MVLMRVVWKRLIKNQLFCFQKNLQINSKMILYFICKPGVAHGRWASSLFPGCFGHFQISFA